MHEFRNKPDLWLLEAARLPLAFAQVREDPRLDVEVASTLPDNATVIMIASGGETLVQLARHPQVRRIHAVDMNPAQLALSRLKCHLAASHTPDESCRLLGHEPMAHELREKEMCALLTLLELPEHIFGPSDFIATHGVDHSGRYERCFAELRRLLIISDLDESLTQVMSLANLVALFGTEATQNPARSFHEHFSQRTRLALAREGAEVNPFWWQMYHGKFAPGHRYDWLQSTLPPHAEVLWQCGRMKEVLDAMPAASADLVHLSNILDWLSAEEAAVTLASTRRVLRAGGRVIIRQLNSSLDFSALGAGLSWDAELGADMEPRDRSFFYPAIHLATRS